MRRLDESALKIADEIVPSLAELLVDQKLDDALGTFLRLRSMSTLAVQNSMPEQFR